MDATCVLWGRKERGGSWDAGTRVALEQQMQTGDERQQWWWCQHSRCSLAEVKLVPFSLAWVKLASCRLAEVKFVPSSLAWVKLAPVKPRGEAS